MSRNVNPHPYIPALFPIFPHRHSKADRPAPQRFVSIYLICCVRLAECHALRWWDPGWRAIHEVSRMAKEQGKIWTHHGD